MPEIFEHALVEPVPCIEAHPKTIRRLRRFAAHHHRGYHRPPSLGVRDSLNLQITHRGKREIETLGTRNHWAAPVQESGEHHTLLWHVPGAVNSRDSPAPLPPSASPTNQLAVQEFGQCHHRPGDGQPHVVIAQAQLGIHRERPPLAALPQVGLLRRGRLGERVAGLAALDHLLDRIATPPQHPARHLNRRPRPDGRTHTVCSVGSSKPSANTMQLISTCRSPARKAANCRSRSVLPVITSEAMPRSRSIALSRRHSATE